MKLKKNSIVAVSALTIMLAPTVLNSVNTVFADEVQQIQNNDTKTNDTKTQQINEDSNKHTITAPYVVFGTGASSEAQTKLKEVFRVDSSFKTLKAGASDYVKFVNPQGNTTDAAMISSVAIVPGDPGSGVKVNIQKFDGESNITQVTAQQYAMVAQIAGVKDVTIVVSANRPVSGESALTGVYKALAEDGVNLNTENTQTANQMLDATAGAIDANKDDKEYPGKLMAAIGDVSKQLSEMKQKQDQLATKDDIQDMLNKALAAKGIDTKTSPEQVDKIINVLINFQKSPIADDKDFSKNVQNTIDNVKNSAGDLMNKAKDWFNSEDGKNAQNFFVKIWNSIVDFFSGLFNSIFNNN